MPQQLPKEQLDIYGVAPGFTRLSERLTCLTAAKAATPNLLALSLGDRACSVPLSSSLVFVLHSNASTGDNHTCKRTLFELCAKSENSITLVFPMTGRQHVIASVRRDG